MTKSFSIKVFSSPIYNKNFCEELNNTKNCMAGSGAGGREMVAQMDQTFLYMFFLPKIKYIINNCFHKHNLNFFYIIL